MAKTLELRLLALDGNNTVGGTKYLVQTDGLGLMLDFGTNYAKQGRYYEQFLQPRESAGLHDLVTMGILPDVRGVYRRDLMLPDLEMHGPEAGRIDAVLVTHAHLDHAGALEFLRPEVPVVATAATAAILKALQDSGSPDMLYGKVKGVEEHRGVPILKASDEVWRRDFILADGAPSRALEAFWQESRWKTIDLPHRDLGSDLGSLGVRSFPVDHSIPGASAFVMDSAQGPLVYPGDIRMHGLHAEDTRRFLEAARSPRPYVLFMEGTSFGREEGETVTEEDVRRNAKDLLASISGEFAIADFGPRNVERLGIFAEAAAEAGRQLVVTAKDAYLLRALHTVSPDVPVPGQGLGVLHPSKGSEGFWEGVALDEYAGAAVYAKEIRQNPGDYLVAFSYLDLKHLADIRPEGGHYLYSSSEAFSEEQEFDFKRLQAWLDRFSLKCHGFWFEGDELKFTEGKEALHASGHAPVADLERIVRTLNPEIIVPLHTGHPETFGEKFAKEYNVLSPPLRRWTDL